MCNERYKHLDKLIIIGKYKIIRKMIKEDPRQIYIISPIDEQSLLMTAVICDEYKIMIFLLKNNAVVTKEILVRAAGFQSSNMYSVNKRLSNYTPIKVFNKLLKYATPDTIRCFSTDLPTHKMVVEKRESLEIHKTQILSEKSYLILKIRSLLYK